MKRRFPPLSVWISAAVLVTLLVVSSAFVLDEMEGHEPFYRNFKSGLQDLELRYQVAEEDEVVIILGSSFTAMGIQHHPYFYERFWSEMGKKVHVFKIYMYECSARDLSQLPEFFEAAGRLKADIVCVEDRLLVFDEYKPGALRFPGWLEGYNLRMEGLMKRLLLALGKEESNDPGTFEFFWKFHEDAIGADSTSMAARSYQLRSYAQNKSVNQRLSELQAQGVELVLLQLPRPKVSTVALQSAKADLSFQELLGRYQSEVGMVHWEYPEILPYDHFSDAHLNRVGMERYSDWLYQQIKAHL